jgi:hypothetical protein
MSVCCILHTVPVNSFAFVVCVHVCACVSAHVHVCMCVRVCSLVCLSV